MPVSLSADPSVYAEQASRTVRESRSIGELSVIHRSSTTVDVCGHDKTFPSFLGTSEYFYDSRAGAYENPLITATSRALISDIHALTRRCCALDMPRPQSLLNAILKVRSSDKLGNDPWFRGVRVWVDVDDISETESFEGHKKSFVQYTLNILFFPDLHTTYKMPKMIMLRHPPSSPDDSQLSLSLPTSPALPIPGTLFSVPSPLHFQLPVMTRLCFNEQGQITHHRDIWDFCDVVRLIPGVRVVVWVMTRAGAWGLSWISQRVCSDTDPGEQHDDNMHEDNTLLTSTNELNV